MVRILVTEDKRPCTRCAGYGTFTDYHELTNCQWCGSIHAEQFGLRYQKDDAKIYLYAQVPLKSDPPKSLLTHLLKRLLKRRG